MKFVIVREGFDSNGNAHSWRLETDSGFVLAKSSRAFATLQKCAKEIADIKKDAAITKIVYK